jgi:hypothetical protein
MPPTAVHFNGGVNLADAETVMRQIAARVGPAARRIPDGETGDRQQWIFFQLQKFWEHPQLEQAGVQPGWTEAEREQYAQFPQVRVRDGVDPATVSFEGLIGYADAYLDSYQTFRRLRDEGVIPPRTRFQVQYPTPLASLASWVVPEHEEALEPAYPQAIFNDLQRLLDAIPHDDLAVQWDVAVEFGLLERIAPHRARNGDLDGIVARLAACVDAVPAEVPVGMHLCYGDYQHGHFKEPTSLATQVEVVNRVSSTARRPVSWFAFTVPQYQSSATYFEPLSGLRVHPNTELYFALVPYHPDEQEAGTTAEQVRLIDAHLRHDSSDALRDWGICTECGMARAEREEVPRLLDLHREILGEFGAQAVTAAKS